VYIALHFRAAIEIDLKTAKRIVLLVRNVCATGLRCIKAMGTCL